ncbi:hypothetical protein ACFOGI_11360 [Virgibacillus xinjiangensis]|uniref:YuzL-like protein n=1 Tax=Virgibacillus xinjiangensis TaxID=393090 RepID=A0ABV7CWV6_9BACI
MALSYKNEGVIQMAENNKRRRHGNSVGSGVGVAPEDTIASALDPFGGAAAAVGEPADDKAKKGTRDTHHRSK